MLNDQNLHSMQSIAADLLAGMLTYTDKYITHSGNRAQLPYATLPPVERLVITDGRLPSSRLTCDIALGYLASYLQTTNLDHLQTAYALLRHAFTMQSAPGHFVWNYGQYEIDQVDLGTVLDVYYYFWTRCPDMPDDIRDGITQSTSRAIDYIKTMDQPNYPGIIQKRAGDPDHPQSRRSADYTTIDVLNGNTLASTAYCRAAIILDDPSLLDNAVSYQQNLIDRFSAHIPGWWAYVEKLDTREMLTPETILYQAMIALYLQPVYEAKKNKLLGNVLEGALKSIEADVQSDGSFDWTHEKNVGFVETQLLMYPSAVASLCELYDATETGLARLKFVVNNLVDPETRLLLDESGQHRKGELADELRQIWAVSDLALIILFAMEKTDGPATT